MPATAKHADPRWKATVRIIRAQTKRAFDAGEEVFCHRCGGQIDPEGKYDVGHLDMHGEPEVDNAAPEHVRCNRSHGGRAGAQITNAKRGKTSTFRPLLWA